VDAATRVPPSGEILRRVDEQEIGIGAAERLGQSIHRYPMSALLERGDQPAEVFRPVAQDLDVRHVAPVWNGPENERSPRQPGFIAWGRRRLRTRRLKRKVADDGSPLKEVPI
jgi:hypothetical protein